MSTPVQPKTPALEMTDVSVDFAVDDVWVPAAKNLNYRIDRGQVVAVVGESGSGKSASSMAILDLLPRNSRVRGSIMLNGREITGLSSRQLRQLRGPQVAAIFQEPMTALNPVLTVGFQIIEAIRAHTSKSPSEARERAMELLGLVGLPDPAKAFASYPHQLSGGQRQRAMIAQAISLDPALLIADEPTTALDVTVQAEILDLLRDLRDRLDSAILLITHDMGVVADLADWIVVMKDGEVVEQGPVAQVLREPRDPYTKELLAAVPRLGEGSGAGGSVDVVEALAQVVEESAHGGSTETAADAAAAPVIVEPVLSLDRVSIEYGKRGRVAAFRAVDEVSLAIAEGEILGLVGESGSGKSTIGRAAIGLQPIADGKLVVDGVDISAGGRKLIGSLRRRVGIVFQDPSSSLNPRLPIGESIGEPLLLSGEAKGADLSRRVETLLDEVRLPRSYRNRYPHELSGGQKQRVGIARALALKPRLLVADEPTSALDVSVQARVLELLVELQREYRFACLFISHDLAVVDAMADRIVVLHNGKIAEQGTRDEILRSPKEAYTQRLIAAIPVPDPEVQAARRALRHKLLQTENDAS
ncbi:peptide/nickel transport system ATP-binding protein [Microbacterium sp. AG1240]|uniref:dipeptide ABC transporter ATP-binding protein n=1 Tax=Microbacterium sp. AG1240 TaxID=2183992 RepID=UPI000EACF030|nr:ABC transporter ATP-binding protein [Microbacterium sp. AG1240]RKT36545.1 peptide/nickel transport system ATP-binding protein [Microbacterium sp. AG1240]